MVVLLLLVPAAAAPAAVTDRDRSFNFTGQVLLDDGGSDIAYAVALQGDGKLVMLSESSTGISRVRRLLPDGSPDDRFGHNGVIPIGTGMTAERLRAVVIQPDGKILVGGTSSYKPVIYRFDAAGKPDPGWGLAGKFQLSERTEDVNALALLPDGRVIAAGGDESQGFVWRVTAGGAIDESFNVKGRIGLVSRAGSLDTALDVAVQPDGKLVVAGRSNSHFNGWAMRLNANSGVDADFEGGVAHLDAGGVETANVVELLPDGRIVVAGNTTAGQNGIVWRLRSNGKLDTSFNETGSRVIDSAGSEHLRALLVQPDGKLVAVGDTSVNHDGAFYRLTTDGQFDRSFDGDGAIGVDAGGIELLTGAVLQPDGNLVAVGRGGPEADVTVFRLLGDPHKLSVSTVGSGTVNCGGLCAGAYDVGTVVALTATPAAGSTVTSWTGCASVTGDVCRVTMSGPRTVKATFTADPPKGQPTTPATGGGAALPGAGGQPGGAGGQPTTPPDRVAPRIRGARVAKGRVRFVLSEDAKVTVTVGAKKITRSLRAGLREVKLGELKRGKITLRAVDAAGNRSSAVRVKREVR